MTRSIAATFACVAAGAAPIDPTLRTGPARQLVELRVVGDLASSR